MNRTRKSSIAELLGNEGIGEVLKSVLGELANEAKTEFFKKLTPQKREAYKIVFSSILKEHADLQVHEDMEIRDNWEAHFIKYHDELIDLLKSDAEEATKAIIEQRGFDFVNEYFIADNRSLEELIDTTAQSYSQAMFRNEEKQSALKELLQTRLESVVDTLKKLSAESNAPIKEFEIELENAKFNVQVAENVECTCGECDNELEDSLEALVKRLLSK